jgi:hypothetical protein
MDGDIMSADRIFENPYDYKFVLTCHTCNKEIEDHNNIYKGHEKCIESQNSVDREKHEHVMRIDFDFIKKERQGRAKYSKELIEEYEDICIAGSITDYLHYREVYRKDQLSKKLTENLKPILIEEDDLQF